MTGDRNRVEVRVDCAGWNAIDCDALALDCFRAVEDQIPCVKRPVSVLFADDAEIRRLNAYYRGKDRPTNVLAFPPGEALLPDQDYLGDIALAFETCRAEAAEKDIALRDHAAHLLVHGMLHLMGYDHDTDEAADVMERREADVLAGLHIVNPYAPRLEREA